MKHPEDFTFELELFKFLRSIQFIRLPSAYYFPKSVSKSPEGKIINFFSAPSAIKSHVGVIHH